ncbi:TonB-dependent receptor [Granulicella tundricola]|uniref:Cna protein B-type domain protein n=1 Tax=Granulicella tundricola (strain ATCC BAA-1859 / DSM 23138 / MP5ACTX9) TaxID=1198114 RepID=E8X6R5_GRATM|nr:carboxypeptidase regulatory-like domain-containing protein [Granulicella tundricola]ADW71215.1 Cna protein B-type domain protein [Granulicella tundricola MP5ACTX9]
MSLRASRLALLPVSFLTLAMIAGSALGQLSTTATISGTVTDATGAVVPDADILITSTDTRVTTSRKSTSDGTFVVPGLTVGTYSITVTKTGFGNYTATGIILHPAVTSTVNAGLTVGSTNTSVEVSAVASLVETSTAENSNSVDAAQVNTLPINGRNYQGLATMMPGAQNTSAGTALTTGGRSTNNVLSVNGMQQNKTFYALDGVWNENTGNMNQTSVVPNPDSLGEVRVLQNNYSARYSLMGSSVVLLSTKSGTRDFHGTAWEFIRNEDLNAKPFFSTAILPYKQNIFGYNIGGPVFIPKVYNRDRNKTFFFFSEQFVILHQTPTGAITGITPTDNQRAGIFGTPITNPATGKLFPQNTAGQYVIPAATINTNSTAFVNALYPHANYSSGSLNYINTVPQVTNQRDDEIKIDHDFSSKFHLLAEYLDEYQKYQQNSLSGAQSGEVYSTNGETDFTHNKLAQVSLSQVLTPNLVNTTNVAMNIFDLDLNLTGTALNTQVPGFNPSLPFAGYISNRIPLVTFSGGIGPEGIPAARPLTHAADLDDTVGDDVSYLHGRHFIQGGVTIVFNTKRQNVSSATNGQFTFTGSTTTPTKATDATTTQKAQATTLDDAFADFLLGSAATFTQTSGQPRVAVHGMEVSPYLEDRFKLTKTVTVTAGLRGYYMPLPYGPPKFETNFIPTSYSLAAAPTVAASGAITNSAASSANPLNGLVTNGPGTGVPQNFSGAHTWYAGPVFGLAWDVFGDGKTSFKGGYGITFTRVFTNQDCSFACAVNPPAIQSVSLVNPTFPAVVGTGAVRPATIAAVSAADQNIQATQVQSYSAGVQHEFPHNFIASATGASSQVRHLLGTWNYNQSLHTGVYDFDPSINSGSVSPYYYQPAGFATPAQFSPYPGYAAITTYTSRQNQNWNALELSLKHPVTKGLFATVAYTYSHDLSTFTSGTYSVVDPYNPSRYYGNAEGLDCRHSMGITLIYDLPIFENSSGLSHKLLGGWKFSDITTLRSGTALTPGLSVATQGNAVRPDKVVGTSIVGPHIKAQWFNTAAYVRPANGFYGNAATGSVRGPGLVDFDMALYKEFHYNETTYFEFRAESFNTFNHTNFTTINTTFGASAFGQATNAADPRILEFAGRVHF